MGGLLLLPGTASATGRLMAMKAATEETTRSRKSASSTGSSACSQGEFFWPSSTFLPSVLLGPRFAKKKTNSGDLFFFLHLSLASREKNKLENRKLKKKLSPPNFGPEATDIHVRLPVFTVHGNHDDPGGADNLSAVDILSTARLVNYFGKQLLVGSGAGALSLAPIVLAKGSVRVALYGLGAIRDERVARVFGGLAGATTATVPAAEAATTTATATTRQRGGGNGYGDDVDDDERTTTTATTTTNNSSSNSRASKRARRDTENAAAYFENSSGIAWIPAPGGADTCFNLFVLHQNRVYRGHQAKNAVPESSLPDFLDLVVWGHEHECRPAADRGFGDFFFRGFFSFPPRGRERERA